jgi:hypothetical protein
LPLLTSSELGIIGAKLIRGDGSIHHAGIDFVMTKLAKPQSKTKSYTTGTRRGRGVTPETPSQPEKKEEEDKNVPIPFYVYQGTHPFY